MEILLKAMGKARLRGRAVGQGGHAASSAAVLLGPVPSIDEELQPRGGGKTIKGRGSPCPLPKPHSPLRVWHECQMATIWGADASYAPWRSIGVQRVLFCGVPIIICPVQRNQALGLDLGLKFRRRKCHVTFPMSTPHRQHRAFHPSKHQGWPWLHTYSGPSGLKPPREIVTEQEAWLCWLGVVVRLNLVFIGITSHPAQKSQQLTAITHAQAEGVWPPAEAAQLFPGLWIEGHCSCPT